MSDKTTNFKQQLDELEKIVEWFESGEVDVDQALKKFQRGMEIVSSLEKWLDDAENTVQEITRAFDGENTENAEGGDKEDG